MRKVFEDVFRTDQPARDNFLARLFGLFNEEVVRIWAGDPRARYEELGRPTLWPPGGGRYHTLDFTLRDRETGKLFVSELKCELSWEGYRYLRLESPDQLDHHKGAAFQAFLDVPKHSSAYGVRLASRPVDVDGIVLVWGAITESGRAGVMAEHGIADVLSLESMLDDLAEWGTPNWGERVDQLRAWSAWLFDYLSPRQ
jgi:hypothetical protein